MQRLASPCEPLVLDEGDLLRLAVFGDDEVVAVSPSMGSPSRSLTVTVCTIRRVLLRKTGARRAARVAAARHRQASDASAVTMNA